MGRLWDGQRRGKRAAPLYEGAGDRVHPGKKETPGAVGAGCRSFIGEVFRGCFQAFRLAALRPKYEAIAKRPITPTSGRSLAVFGSELAVLEVVVVSAVGVVVLESMLLPVVPVAGVVAVVVDVVVDALPVVAAVEPVVPIVPAEFAWSCGLPGLARSLLAVLGWGLVVWPGADVLGLCANTAPAIASARASVRKISRFIVVLLSVALFLRSEGVPFGNLRFTAFTNPEQCNHGARSVLARGRSASPSRLV